MKSNLNLLFAVVFLIGFFFVWENLIMSRYAKRPAPARPPATAPQSPSLSPGSDKSIPYPLEGAIKETATVLRAEGVEVVFESHGGAVSSWKVKEKDHWLELVLSKSERVHSPLETFPELAFRVVKKSEQHAVFTARHPSGILIEKTITLLAQPPFHSVSLRFFNPGKTEQSVLAELGWGNGLAKTPVGNIKDEKAVIAEMRAAGLAGEQVRTWKAGLIFNRSLDQIFPGPFKWIAVDNHHFMAAFISRENEIPQAHVIADRNAAPAITVPLNCNLKPGASQLFEFRLYVGPKSYSSLLRMEHELWRAVDFGFFGIIAKILLQTLAFFKSLTGNYGWAIILLTLCIQLLVFPLTRKSLQHSVKMKEIQPHLKKIQEQFKSDPKRLQVETMNFYRKNGMKLMGMEGCLPVMLQIPIFIAFYTTLNAAYELRGAPWILWIHDLGLRDPYYILPILMGLGMFLQQKMTAATAADPAQAKMMMFMPVIFTVMFLKLPAGLVLYWCVNSLTTIVIQQIMKKNMARHQAVV